MSQKQSPGHKPAIFHFPMDIFIGPFVAKFRVGWGDFVTVRHIQLKTISEQQQKEPMKTTNGRRQMTNGKCVSADP